jgi:hypothetical protein
LLRLQGLVGKKFRKQCRNSILLSMSGFEEAFSSNHLFAILKFSEKLEGQNYTNSQNKESLKGHGEKSEKNESLVQLTVIQNLPKPQHSPRSKSTNSLKIQKSSNFLKTQKSDSANTLSIIKSAAAPNSQESEPTPFSAGWVTIHNKAQEENLQKYRYSDRLFWVIYYDKDNFTAAWDKATQLLETNQLSNIYKVSYPLNPSKRFFSPSLRKHNSAIPILFFSAPKDKDLQTQVGLNLVQKLKHIRQKSNCRYPANIYAKDLVYRQIILSVPYNDQGRRYSTSSTTVSSKDA